MLVLMGILDWLTTIVGVAFLGASEANPLLTELTTTNLVLHDSKTRDRRTDWASILQSRQCRIHTK